MTSLPRSEPSLAAPLDSQSTAMEIVATRATPSWKSERWDQPVTLSVLNLTGAVLYIGWIDYQGQTSPNQVHTVQSQSTWSQSSFATHPFWIRDHRHNVHVAFRANVGGIYDCTIAVDGHGALVMTCGAAAAAIESAAYTDLMHVPRAAAAVASVTRAPLFPYSFEAMSLP
jgi:hypothetical protein